MSSRRFDWDPHLPRMIELYKLRRSIPRITQDIQDQATGFNPSQRSVYKKLNDGGYPTDPDERENFLSSCDGSTSADQTSLHNHNANRLEVSETSSNGPVSPGTLTGTYHSSASVVDSGLESWVCTLPDHLLSCPDEVSLQGSQRACGCTPYETDARFQLEQENAFNLPNRRQAPYLNMALSPCDQVLGSNDNREECQTSMLDHDFLDIYDFQDPADCPITLSMSTSLTARECNSKETESGRAFELKSQDFPKPILLDNIWTSSSTPAELKHPEVQLPVCSFDLARSPTKFGAPGHAGHYVNPNPESPQSFNLDKHSSASTKGYGFHNNGSVSPQTHLLGTVPVRNSLLEFKGMYRVPCFYLHEPQPLDESYKPQPQSRFKDLPQCRRCYYNGIHNISWSARYLRPEVLQAELSLRGTYGMNAMYDIDLVDCAGNSALHYAAAGGAGSDHFNVLIAAGADPLLINTAGQVFIHCLKPHIRQDGSIFFDADLVEAFIICLINLLNNFQPKGVFKWPDNDGNTAMGSLFSCLTDRKILEKTIRRVRDAGYDHEVSDACSRLELLRHRNHLDPPSNESTFKMDQDKQDKAFAILGRSSINPLHVDFETGDNIFHALSRIRLPTSIKLQECVWEGANLNHCNHQLVWPLTSFILERPFRGVSTDETEATMSKYLDILLWKDVGKCMPNVINVNVKCSRGGTALYYAAVMGRADSVRSLIEGGANVNARLGFDGTGPSILQATVSAKARESTKGKNQVKINNFSNVISYLEHSNAVADPTIYEERALAANSITRLPM